MAKWLESGELRVVEDVTEGLEHAYDAFLTLFHDVPQQGGAGNKTNLGKKIVRIAAQPPLPLPAAARL